MVGGYELIYYKGGFYKLLSRDFETGFEQIVGFHEGVMRCIMTE